MKQIIDIDEDYVKIINKNGASNYPEEVIKNGTPLDDVLDKIRAEITENIEAYRMSDWETNNILADGLQMALNIINGIIEEGEKK